MYNNIRFSRLQRRKIKQLVKLKTKMGKKTVFYFQLSKQSKTYYTYYKQRLYYGSSFKETILDCLLCLAALVNTTERQDGAHHGRRTLCSPFRQATGDVNNKQTDIRDISQIGNRNILLKLKKH